jgi:hypothetical protein
LETECGFAPTAALIEKNTHDEAAVKLEKLPTWTFYTPGCFFLGQEVLLVIQDR